MKDRAALRDTVEELYARYAEALDDDHLEAWPELFTPQCLYRVTSLENHRQGLPLSAIRCESRGMLVDRVNALRNTAMYIPRTQRHVISGISISPLDDTGLGAEVTATFVVFQSLPEEHTQLFLCGKYLDRIVCVDGSWLFAEKLCVYDSALVPNSLVLPL